MISLKRYLIIAIIILGLFMGTAYFLLYSGSLNPIDLVALKKSIVWGWIAGGGLLIIFAVKGNIYPRIK